MPEFLTDCAILIGWAIILRLAATETYGRAFRYAITRPLEEVGEPDEFAKGLAAVSVPVASAAVLWCIGEVFDKTFVAFYLPLALTLLMGAVIALGTFFAVRNHLRRGK